LARGTSWPAAAWLDAAGELMLDRSSCGHARRRAMEPGRLDTRGALTSVAPERNKARALATPRLFSSANQRATWGVAGTRLGDAVVLVSHGGVDVVHSDVVDRCDAVARFAGGDEFGDGLGASAAGEGGLAETVVGVEDDGNGGAEGVEAAGVAGAVVVEVDFLEEGRSGVGELHGSVAAEDDDVERATDRVRLASGP
jgi:hypothetical protein